MQLFPLDALSICDKKKLSTVRLCLKSMNKSSIQLQRRI